MKNSLRFPKTIACLIGAMALFETARAATVTLPSDAAAPPGSASNPGFLVRSVQAPPDAIVANNILRAVKQLNGTLTDADGAPVPNEAIAGPNIDGSYNVDLINFEKDGAEITVLDDQGAELAYFFPVPFPGIPGAGAHADNFAVEVIAYLELTAGTHTFGISAGADRTDVNDDDAYQVFVGPNCRDYFALKVAEFQRIAQGFVADQHIENQWTVQAPVTGIYPFRLVYWQTGHGANLQWYSITPDTQERLLVNDSADPRAIKAYRATSVSRANSPYVAEVSPLPGSSGNSAASPIEALLFDGQSNVNTNAIKLFLNSGAAAPFSLSKNGNRTALQYQPNASRTDPNNLIRLEYADATGANYTNTWQFTIEVSGAPSSQVTGHWDFDQGDLRATVGKALEYLDGPAGLTAAGTKFGATGEGDFAEIPLIDGSPAKIMYVPGDLSRKIGYLMDHGIAPNGGGTKVNQYTLIMDVLLGATGPGAAAMLQISSVANTDDGDLFWQGNNFGQGTGGYNGTGAFTPGEWHRVCAAYDQAAKPPVVTKFVDGIKQDDWTANQGLDNPRRALQAKAVLFADGDQDERREWWVNCVQIREGKMSDAEMEALGGPTAAGIPLPQPPVTPPTLVITRSATQVTITWPAAAAGFVLESSPALPATAWTPVPGVTGNSATVSATSETQFYRLKK